MYLYNIIIIYLLLGVIINYMTGINFSMLNCGIFAWVGKDTKFFRRDLFNILGMYNDSRGGDACGIYFDDDWYKGIGTSAKYEKLIVSYNLHNTLKLKKYPVIIGHDRKVSVGYMNIENAQPVVLVNNRDEEEEVVYVQAHNGTITNYRDLAKKHNIIVEAGESDSITLARLIDKVGWSILEEYEGSAALVMYDKEEPNVLYAFHGKSRASEYVALAEERPLSYITFPGKGTYISSDIAHLSNLSIPEKKINPIEFQYNTLYRLEGDNVMEMLEVDRTKINLPTPKKHTSNTTSYFNSIKKSPLQYKDNVNFQKAIRYNAGIFQIENKAAHGVYYLDSWGYDVSNLKFNSLNHYEVCFIYGTMMRDRLSYEIMLDFINKNKIATIGHFYNLDTFNKLSITALLKKYAATPFWRYSITENFVGYIRPNVNGKRDKFGGNHYFDGEYIFPLSRYIFKMSYGDITEMKEDKYLMTLGELERSLKEGELDFSFSSEEKVRILKSTISGNSEKENTIIKDVSNSYGYSIPSECEKCNKWSTDYQYCSTQCPIIDKPDYNDSSDQELGITTIKESFKEVEDAIDTAIDTYDSLAIDIKNQDVEDIINKLKEVKGKLILN